MTVEPDGEFTFQFGQLAREFLRAAEQFAHLHESPHHKDAHADGLRTVEDVGGHDRAVFGESVGKKAASAV